MLFGVRCACLISFFIVGPRRTRVWKPCCSRRLPIVPKHLSIIIMKWVDWLYLQTFHASFELLAVTELSVLFTSGNYLVVIQEIVISSICQIETPHCFRIFNMLYLLRPTLNEIIFLSYCQYCSAGAPKLNWINWKCSFNDILKICNILLKKLMLPVHIYMLNNYELQQSWALDKSLIGLQGIDTNTLEALSLLLHTLTRFKGDLYLGIQKIYIFHIIKLVYFCST